MSSRSGNLRNPVTFGSIWIVRSYQYTSVLQVLGRLQTLLVIATIFGKHNFVTDYEKLKDEW